ncbi:MAG: peptide chain release factor N(5)-glutamine methyltransferase [Alphaproteobacteria bacterium]|nr:peptide chain release factor N(5)-glutamine methyltransferase [Alphaproteobacteria bacterium]
MTLDELYKTLRVALSESDALYVLRKRADADYGDLIADPGRIVDEMRAMEDLERHRRGEPLSRIYGEREFWGLRFALSPETLDPRADTETLVEAALAAFPGEPPRKILDLGTGSGCILIALLSEWPDSVGVGVDLSPGALDTARRNAAGNSVAGRAHFVCGAWGAALAESFDLVISNPPYISNHVIPTLDEEVRFYDPILALDGGEDGLQAYRDIFSGLSGLINQGGKALFEIGFDQEKSAVRLAEESGFLVKHVHRDLAGQPRALEISSGDK